MDLFYAPRKRYARPQIADLVYPAGCTAEVKHPGATAQKTPPRSAGWQVSINFPQDYYGFTKKIKQNTNKNHYNYIIINYLKKNNLTCFPTFLQTCTLFNRP